MVGNLLRISRNSAIAFTQPNSQLRTSSGWAFALTVLGALITATVLALWLRGNSTQALLLAPLVCVLWPIAGFGLGVISAPTDALDARNLAVFGVSAKDCALQVLAAGFVHPAALLALLPAVVLAFVAPVHTESLFRIAAAALLWLVWVLAFRFGVRTGRAVIARRLGRELGSVFWYVLSLAVTLLFLGLVSLPWQQTADEAAPMVTGSVGWLPLANLALNGQLGNPAATAVMNGVLVLTLLACELLLTYRDATRALYARTPGGRVSLGIFAVAPSNATWSIAARTWLSWLRDRRYRLMLVMVALLPSLLVIPSWLAGVGTEVLVLLPVPIFAIFFGWALHNDIAYDSTALWLHATGGLPGRADRLGRAIPTLVTGTVLITLGALLVWWVRGEASAGIMVWGLSLGLLGCGVGGSSVMSVLAPYPVARPGESPWSQPISLRGGAFAVHGIVLLLEITLCAPSIWFVQQELRSHAWLDAMLAAGIGLVIGAVVTVLGVVVGGKLFTARRTRLLSYAILEG